MQAEQVSTNRRDLAVGVRQEHRNLPAAALVEQAILRGEGIMAEGGALAVTTAPYTGRSPNDKFIVREPSCEDVIWWGKVNVAMSAEAFDALHGKVLAYLQGRDVFVQDNYTCADPNYRMRVRVISEAATAALFATNMFIEPAPADLAGFQPDFTVLHAPHFRAQPAVDETRSVGICRHQLLQRVGPGRRDRLCRGDQEVDLHGPQLPHDQTGRPAHALFGQCE